MSGTADNPVPRFSVIMPVYDHQRYVGQAIESVRDQTLPQWELLAVDDGSTDASGSLLDQAAAKDPRIRVVHQANAGQSAARNHGLRLARGEWIAYLDSDDIWYPNALRNYAECIGAHPEAQFVYGYRHRLDDDGSIIELPAEYQDGPTGPAELFESVYLSPLRVCHRKDLVEQSGLFDERLRVFEDVDLFLRMGLHTRYRPTGKPTGLRRRHNENVSRQSGWTRSVQAAVLERFARRFGEQAGLDDRRVRRRLAQLRYAAGRQYFRGRYFHQAMRALKQSLEYRSSARAAGLLVLANALVFLGRTDRQVVPEL